MFTTDSFLGAEIRYRQEKVRQDYGTRRWVRARNDADANANAKRK